jgi:toxin ParE1/3/4
MQLHLTPRALEDIADIADYIKEHNPIAALRVRASIFAAMQSLMMYPMSGRLLTSTIRRIVTAKYHYLIYYKINVELEEVEIVTVQHPSRAREYTDA